MLSFCRSSIAGTGHGWNCKRALLAGQKSLERAVPTAMVRHCRSMSNRDSKLNWDDLKVVRAIVEAGGHPTLAAEAAGVDPPQSSAA